MQCQFVVGCTDPKLRYNSKPSYILKTNMAKKSTADGTSLVIVESPAKARTISKFLGPGYTIEASIGHIRDLPQGAKEIPAEYKKEEWAYLGVNVNHDFEPVYIVPPEKPNRCASSRAF